MVRLCLSILALCAAGSVSATSLFVPGDLVWGTERNFRLFEMTPGVTSPNASSLTAAATIGGFQAGQIAFSADNGTAYVTSFDSNSVKAISATGQVTTFATGINGPTGIVRTSTGKILVSDYYRGNIYDISSGGDFTTAIPYASGLINPRNMTDTPTGVLVTDWASGKVFNIGMGGNVASMTPFAFNLSQPVSIVHTNGKTYVSTDLSYRVFDISAGGNMSGKSPFASGREFYSLAASGTKLYAGTSYNSASTSIFDITAGGNFASRQATFFNLPGAGSSLLAVVPQAQTVSPVQPPIGADSAVPEPATIAMTGAALMLAARKVWLTS